MDITIWNNTGEDNGLDGLIFSDDFGAEYNITDVNGDPVAFTFGATVTDFGPYTVGGCEVSITRSSGWSKGKQPKLEPEHIGIDPGGLLIGESCVIRITLETDGNPGHATGDKVKGEDYVEPFSLYEPTSCETTLVLNEGVQVLLDDGDTEGEVNKNDTPLFLDDDTIELTCVFD